MNANTLENVRQMVHVSSLVLLCAVFVIGAVGTLKPQLFRRVFKEFSERKYILSSAVFACLLCGTVFTATQSMSRPYELSKSGISNTAGSLEQPNRQVYGQSDQAEEEVSGGSEFDQPSENTSGTTQPNQPQKASTASRQPPASPPRQPQAAGSVPTNSNPAQTPAPTREAPTAPKAEKDCKILRLVCL